MFCNNCGTQINESAKFCTNCGNKIDTGSLETVIIKKKDNAEFEEKKNNFQGGLLANRNINRQKDNNQSFNSTNQYNTNNTTQFNNTNQYNNANYVVNKPIEIYDNSKFEDIKESRSFILYLIFSFITSGIYSIFFWHKYIKDLNLVCDDDEDSPNVILVLIFSVITFGIYYFYWMYKHSNRIKNAGEKFGVNIKQDGVFVLVWSIIAAIFTFGLGILLGQYFMIYNFNKITEKIKN